MVIGITVPKYKKKGGGSSNEKATSFYECHSSGFFLNSCGAATLGIITGGGTLGCVAYEDVKKERCPALVEIDEQLKN